MTVENPNTKNTYRGNGVTTVFPFTFALHPEDADNVVVVLTNETGQENLTTDFTISMNDKNVHYPKSGTQPLPPGWKITIQRQIPYTQTLNLTSQGPFFADDIEAQFDRQEMQIQQLAESVERTVRVDVSSDVDPAELIAKIFRTGMDVSAQLLAAQQSASAAAGSEANARNSESAAREAEEHVNAVIASVAEEIKQNLSVEYVPQEQAKREHDELRSTLTKEQAELRAEIANAGIAILQRSKTYAVGDIAYSQRLPSWARLECVKAGMTAGDEPAALAQVTSSGVLLTDGGVVWIVDDARDGTPVGAVCGSLYLPAGYVKANGATVARADYPRLVALAEKYSLWIDDTTSNSGLFGRGDGNATMVLPNWTRRMMQFADGNIGISVAAGLPNIYGYIETRFGFARGTKGIESATGALSFGYSLAEYTVNVASVYNKDAMHTVTFNAAASNPIYGASATVQPPAINVLPIIKY